MSGTIRAYVNGRAVDVPEGSSALDAVRLADPAAAEAVAAGSRALADSRGLPMDPAGILAAGTIMRIVSGRRRDGGPA